MQLAMFKKVKKNYSWICPLIWTETYWVLPWVIQRPSTNCPINQFSYLVYPLLDSFFLICEIEWHMHVPVVSRSYVLKCVSKYKSTKIDSAVCCPMYRFPSSALFMYERRLYCWIVSPQAKYISFFQSAMFVIWRRASTVHWNAWKSELGYFKSEYQTFYLSGTQHKYWRRRGEFQNKTGNKATCRIRDTLPNAEMWQKVFSIFQWMFFVIWQILTQPSINLLLCRIGLYHFISVH